MPGVGTPTQSVLMSSITQVIVDGQSGNDTLTQANFLPMTVVFNGGSGNDTLNISAGVFTIAGNPAPPLPISRSTTADRCSSPPRHWEGGSIRFI